MKWNLICLVLLYTKSVAPMEQNSQSSGSESGAVGSEGDGNAAGGAEADTKTDSQSLSMTVGVDATVTTEGVGGEGEGAASASVSVKAQETTTNTDTSTRVTVTPSPTPPPPSPTTSTTTEPPVVITTQTPGPPEPKTPTPTTTSSTTPPIIPTPTPPPPTPPTPTPPTPTLPPPPTPTTPKPTPPPHKCSVCELDDFMGFGFMAGKCGCCPWPCCCKCIKKKGKQGPCRELLDLAFIIDASGSIGTIDWEKVKSFFNNVVSGLTSVGTDQHVAALTFSTEAKIQWNLDSEKTSSLSNLQTAISKLANMGQFTNTADAIEKATKRIFTEPQDNPKAANVAVVMTDGRANFRTGEIKDLAEKLRDKATTICIGVTDEVNDKELEDICEDRIYKVSQFEELAGIVLDLQTEICPTPPVREKCYCCCTPEMYFGDKAASRYYW